jgi:hypothetical protein
VEEQLEIADHIRAAGIEDRNRVRIRGIWGLEL